MITPATTHSHIHMQLFPPSPLRYRTFPLSGKRLQHRKFTTVRTSFGLRVSNNFHKNGSTIVDCKSTLSEELNEVAEQKQKKQVRRAYPFHQIEPRWQGYWEENRTFRTPDDIDTSKPKFYVLDMFPYPSGSGLHVGHPLGYTATDILARLKRMQGYNVLHPMGWDAFGLPAEQYAIETGTHPKITTMRNIERFRTQVQNADSLA